VELEEWHRWWKMRGASGLRRLLMDEWDPIGVRDFPAAADEYDVYVGRVGRMLREKATAAELVRYLTDVRTQHMGLSSQEGRETEVVEAVTAWYRQEMRAPDF
jgi:hypothetical protein